MKSSLSKWIEHLIKRELYGNGTKEQVVELLNEVYEKILKEMRKSPYISTKTEYQKILKHIEEILAEYSTVYKAILITQISDISNVESEWLQGFMKELGKDFVIPATLISTLRFSPVATATNYEQLVDTSVNRIKTNVDNALRTAYIMKEDTTNNTERLSRKVEKEVSNVMTEVEAFNTTAFSMTDYLMFRANKEKVRYTAILDNLNCIACGDMDGQIFNINEAPMLPLHYNCRCSLIPMELDEVPSYSDWFEEQTDEIKRQILGKTRFELYKEQGLQITNFVNNGEIIPLKDLKIDSLL